MSESNLSSNERTNPTPERLWVEKHKRILLCALAVKDGLTDDTGVYDRMREASRELIAILERVPSEAGDSHQPVGQSLGTAQPQGGQQMTSLATAIEGMKHWDWCPICRGGLDTGLECDKCGADFMPICKAFTGWPYV